MNGVTLTVCGVCGNAGRTPDFQSEHTCQSSRAGEVLRAVTERLPHSWCPENGWHDEGACAPVVTTWADGYGRWHASVPLSTNPRGDAMRARRAIRAEMEARDEIGPGYRVRVARERVTPHGTAIYREA